MSEKFRQELHTKLYQLFQITGSFTDIKQLDRFQTVAAQLATVIQKQAQSESIELMRKLQKAVSDGFKETFAANIELEKRITGFKKTFAANAELEKRITGLEGKINDLMSDRSDPGEYPKDVPKDRVIPLNTD